MAALALTVVFLTACEGNSTGPLSPEVSVRTSAPFLLPFSPPAVQLFPGQYPYQAYMDVLRPAGADPKDEVRVSTYGDVDVIDVGELKSLRLGEMPCPGDCRIRWRLWVNVWGMTPGYRALRFENKSNPQDSSVLHVFVGYDTRG
jgi:hypothetical protein